MLLSVAWFVLLTAGAAEGSRSIPKPLPHHPGNFFLSGESIVVALPPEATGGDWRLVDYEGRTVAQGTNAAGPITLGQLPVGYYELQPLREGLPEKSRVSLGVLAPLVAPTPRTSPIGVDVAMAQLFPVEQHKAAANLAALAGMNWVRDRLHWRIMEPEKGRFVETSAADESARWQTRAGLQVLQVHCDSPSWTGSKSKRLPTDLRDAHRFMEAMARRWRGLVLAFEPWNEADTPNFGGHIGSEIAAYQKACYLGLKAGNPDVIVCQNVFASPHPNVLADFNANLVWPYFDTFNLHHYTSTDEYVGVYAAFRAISAGKPLWVTEFNLPVQWAGDEKEQEPTDADLRVQAERVAQLFAAALHEGPAVALYFLLPHYSEGQTQYGVLCKDLTPRPAFIALAAVGRILADARPLGRLRPDNVTRVFAFRARPDGEERDVVVAWTMGGQSVLELPVTPLAVFDHLGRAQTNVTRSLKISPAPMFAVFKKDALNPTMLQSPPRKPALKPGNPSPVVLQALMPEEKVDMNLSAYICSSAKPESILVAAYNFDRQPVTGELTATAPDGWRVTLPSRLELSPGERKELTVTVDSRGRTTTPADVVRIAGSFGSAGEAVLSLRLAPQPFTVLSEPGLVIRGAQIPERWQPIAPAGSELKITKVDGGLSFTVRFGTGDRWVFPMLALNEPERPVAGSIALVATITAVEGPANFRAIFEEENRSTYFAPFYPQPKPGETVEAMALFDAAMFGEGWSPPDDNGQLDVSKIRTIRIGCNPESDKVVYAIKNVRWVRRGAAGR